MKMALEGGPKLEENKDIAQETKEEAGNLDADSAKNMEMDNAEKEMKFASDFEDKFGVALPGKGADASINIGRLLPADDLSGARDKFIGLLNDLGIEATSDDVSGVLHIIKRNSAGDEIKDTRINITVLLAGGKGLSPDNSEHKKVIDALENKGLIINRKMS